MAKNNPSLMILILFLALVLRFFGIDWDRGAHLHPDERMLIMVAERLNFFNQLNPDFFNYGSLPIYLLKGAAQLVEALLSINLTSYDGLLYVGRLLSVISDLLTIFLIYKIANVLFSTGSGNNEIKLPDKSRSSKYYISLFSAFFYSIAFFPIQNSHFFVVDVFLTTLTSLLVYLLLKYFNTNHQLSNDRNLNGNHNLMFVSLMGIVFAAMLATKFTAIIFLPIISLVLIFAPGKRIREKILNLSIIYILSSIFFFFFMPYAFLNYPRFISDIAAQIKMNSDPYIFPYTLQYVGTIPYLYYLKNIFLWGLGPIISILSLVGMISFLKYQISNIKYQKHISKIKYFISNMNILFLIFYILYFLIIGRSAVKFMRYMLPIYPFLAMMAGYGIYRIKNSKLKIKNFVLYGLLTLQTLWTLMFVNIYSQPHTRSAATEWILKNIPKGKTLAVEHWDDRVPMIGGESYTFIELPLYEQPDDLKKWFAIDEMLEQADYIIIASNRLYTPLQKLSDCSKYKFCYPRTAGYYKKLFSDELGFQKIAEFAVYPKLEVGSWKLEVNDQSADESFTVYDHPKIMVFKKI